MKKRPIPDVLTAEEQAQLLAGTPSGSLLQRRNEAMLRLMLNLGLRSQEVCDLRASDIGWSSGKLVVRGKGGRQRILWLSANDLAFLQEFAQEAQSLPICGSPSGNLFRTGTGQKIIIRFLRTFIANVGARAGLEKHIHPHLLRHTFATDLLRVTKNLPLVQKALGHSNIGTTQIYTHIVDDELESALKSLRR